MSLRPLRVVSMMADNSAPLHRAVAQYIARSGVAAHYVENVPWRQRQDMLLDGDADLGFICGLPYAIEADRAQPRIALIAAPVMLGERYGGRPVYFSDVVVRADSDFRTFEDLRGASWAYNEPGSHSGYWLTRHHLARLGNTSGFFSSAVEAGSHQSALSMVLNREVHGSSIDSTVLETELRRDPLLARRIRVIATLGPSAAPPMVASTRLPQGLRHLISELVTEMHQDCEGRAVLEAGRVARYAPCEDALYNDIRSMACRAQNIPLVAARTLARGA